MHKLDAYFRCIQGQLDRFFYQTKSDEYLLNTHFYFLSRLPEHNKISTKCKHNFTA